MANNDNFFTAEGNPTNSKFKNSSGVLLTRSLFLETSANRDNVVYTLRDDETRGYPSLRRLYLAMADTTEYEFATRYFENFQHWESLCEASWFQPYISAWRRELDLKLKAEELSRIREVARSGGRDALQASKYLLDKGYDKPSTNKRGRPTKSDISQEAHRIAQDRLRVEEDFERILGNG